METGPWRAGQSNGGFICGPARGTSGPRPTPRAGWGEHRFLTRTMRRTTETPLGRGGRAPRLDQGIVRQGIGEDIPARHGVRGAWALSRPVTCELIDT